MSSNTTTKPKKSNGAPNYTVLYHDLQHDIAKVRREYRTLLDQINKQDSLIATKQEYIDMLHVEASQSVGNLQERNYYKLCAWGWGTAAVLLAASWIFFAVKL